MVSSMGASCCLAQDYAQWVPLQHEVLCVNQRPLHSSLTEYVLMHAARNVVDAAAIHSTLTASQQDGIFCTDTCARCILQLAPRTQNQFLLLLWLHAGSTSLLSCWQPCWPAVSSPLCLAGAP